MATSRRPRISTSLTDVTSREVSSITPTEGSNTSASATPNVSPRPASSRRWAASGTVQPALGPATLDPGDNALAETVIGLFKTEVIHRRGPWRSIDAVEFATLERVDWYNNRRLLEPIGYIPPAEAEANFFQTLQPHRMAA